MQRTSSSPFLPKWPFYVADVILLSFAFSILLQGGHNGLSALEVFLAVGCVFAGAAVLVLPFWVEFTTQAKLHVLEHDEASWQRVQKLDAVLSTLENAQNLFNTTGFEKQTERLNALDTRLVQLDSSLQQNSATEFVQASLGELTSAVKALHEMRLEDKDALKKQLAAVNEKMDALKEAPAPEGTLSSILAAIKTLRETMKNNLAQTGAGALVPGTPLLSKAFEQNPSAAGKTTSKLIEGSRSGTTAPMPGKTASKKSADGQATKLTVHALIGIGNKPYLRGNGGGLSETQGIEMDFVEIGKWQWIPKEPIAQPIQCTVLLNDENPAGEGSFTVKPGEATSITPRFPH